MTSVGAGSVLIICVILAVIWRNSPFASTYDSFWSQKELFGHSIYFSLRGWLNDVWMSLFFLFVSLEIKHEMQDGVFKDRRKIANPVIVSIISMAAPMLVCGIITYGTPAFRAWPIPLATDIALSLAMIDLAGNRLPAGSRAYMASIALIDDIGGIILVAVLFTAAFFAQWAAACILITAVLWQVFKRWEPPTWLLAIAFIPVWLTFHLAGVPAALSGVVFALAVPAVSKSGRESLTCRCMKGLKPWVNLLILPIFIIANAGAQLSSGGAAGFDWRLFLGISLGLLIGKPVSMFVSGMLLHRSGVGRLPAGTTPLAFAGISIIGGVGLKMCVYLSTLAFPKAEHGTAILGIYAGMASSAIIAAILLRGGWVKPAEHRAAA